MFKKIKLEANKLAVKEDSGQTENDMTKSLSDRKRKNSSSTTDESESVSDVDENIQTPSSKNLAEENVIKNPKTKLTKFTHGLKHYLEQKLIQLNQPVNMTDILVKQIGKGRGEFYSEENLKNSYVRIQDHVAMLASLADTFHKKQNCIRDGTIFTIKVGHEHCITRLILHEFSLYPQKKPISEKNFRIFLAQLEKIAKECSANLYLILSSIPVVTDKQELISCVVHVQCGSDPILNILNKISTTSLDPVYPETRYVDYSSEIRGFDDTPAVPRLTYYEPMGIEYGGTTTIACKTYGGAQFTTVIDICFDHFWQEGKKSFSSQMKLMTQSNQLIPEQISQVVVSDSVDFYENAKITEAIVRCDSRKSYQMKEENNIPSLVMDFKDDLSSVRYDKKKYPHLHLETRESKLAIINPPFGPDCEIAFYPPYELSKSISPFKEQISAHNMKLIENAKLNHPLFNQQQEPKENTRGTKLHVKRL